MIARAPAWRRTLGIAQGALDYAVGYAKERRQFGKAIAEFEGIQFMLADMEAQTAAARAMVYMVSQMIDDGSPEVAHTAAIAKLLAGGDRRRERPTEPPLEHRARPR